MSKKNFAYLLLAVLVVGFLAGFTFGGMFISKREPASDGNASANVHSTEDLDSEADRAYTMVEEASEPEVNRPSLPGVETRTLLEGTPWQTTLYIIRGAQPDPKMLVLGGVHGDEEAAYWSGEAASRLRVSRGTLYVISHLNEVARKRRTREGLGDINRKFPGDPNGDPEQRLCWEVSSLIRQEGIKMVMTFHEALGFHSEPPHHPGQTFYYDWDTNPYAGTPLTARAQQIISGLNRKIMSNPRGYAERELFTTHVDPIPTSATYELMRQVGVEYAYGCEVCKNNQPQRRVWFHLTALTTWMEMEGFAIDNWPEVESWIWHGGYSGW